MKLNPVLIRSIMHTQFDELKRIKVVSAATADKHFAFQPLDVDEVFITPPSEGRNIWFRLKDGAYVDARGGTGDKSVEHSCGGVKALPPAVLELMDALDVMDKLPLGLVPLSSATLSGARLVKNVRLETMVEVHADRSTGSLQMKPDDLKDAFPRFPEDQRLIKSLSALHSYDVYSLRMDLRRLNIAVDQAALELSEPMKAKLDTYTPEFTLPLVRAIFGGDGADIRDREGLTKVFRDPDRARAAERLRTMSQKTRIPVEELPGFLERYADSFLSVAYYQYSFETVVPRLKRCVEWLRDPSTAIRGGPLCKKVEEAIGFLLMTIRERLRLFRTSFSEFWADMSQESFARLRQQVEAKYVATGGMLCGLAVKMRHWTEAFQTPQSGGPGARIQYLGSDMEPGLTRLCEFAAKA